MYVNYYNDILSVISQCLNSFAPYLFREYMHVIVFLFLWTALCFYLSYRNYCKKHSSETVSIKDYLSILDIDKKLEEDNDAEI